MRLIDAHCHLDFDTFDEDREQVIADARKIGIERIVLPGVDVENWPKIDALCTEHAMLDACFGLHPYYVETHRSEHVEQLESYANTHDCVAIGECGLDFRAGQAGESEQLSYFESQLSIARNLNKPVVIHAVRATESVIETIKKFPDVNGMIHSYSGSYEQAMQLIELGFYISLGGTLTYDRARKLRETARRLPLGSILIETDAPDQADASHHGQRNEPAYLVDTLTCLAELRGEDIDTIADHSFENASALFSLN